MSISTVLYKSKKLKDETSPVRLRLYFGKAHYISLGENARPSEWNPRAGRFSAKAELYEEKNAKLRKAEQKARIILNEMGTFSFHEFKLRFTGDYTSATVRAYLVEYIQELEDKGKIGNSKKYVQLKNMLHRFNKSPFVFKDVTYNFLNKFEIFLGKRRIKNSSMHFYMRQLRATINEAIRRGLLDKELYPFATQFNKSGYSFAHLKGDYNPKPLTLPELEKLKQFPLADNPEYEHSLDIFMFLIRARGLNFVDLSNLTRESVHDDRLKYIRQKTGKVYSIKITPEMQEIMDKYIGQTYLFPILDTAPEDLSARYHHIRKALKVFNEQLKEIAKVCGIEKNVTSYTARYTYTNILVKNNVSMPLIQQALGHSSIATTQHYIQKYSDSEVDKVDLLI
jgi:integrase/recombinase XerD